MFAGELWFEYLTQEQRDLVEQAYSLINYAKTCGIEFKDYSFAVFPMAKAYEGFLKQFFRDRRLIDQETFAGERFRIGKALNPQMSEKHRWWLYGRLTELCGGESVPKQLWNAWKQGRNLLFHFFPRTKQMISLPEAEAKLTMLAEAMAALFGCEKKNYATSS